MRPVVNNLLTAFLLAACAQPPAEFDIVEVSLAAVDGSSWSGHPSAIETSYKQYQDSMIAVEGIRLGSGLPPGLGSHQYAGLHSPPRPGKEFRVFIVGNVPPEHGKRYRVIGRIVFSESAYHIEVEEWEELPLE
jgi:hypothetical protein